MKMPTRPRIQEVRTPKLKKKFVKGSEPPEKIAGSRKFPQPKGIDGAVGGVKKWSERVNKRAERLTAMERVKMLERIDRARLENEAMNREEAAKEGLAGGKRFTNLDRNLEEIGRKREESRRYWRRILES